MTSSEKSGPAEDKDIVAAAAAAAEEGTSSQRNLTRWQYWLLFALGLTYTSFHLLVLNVISMETWTFRIIHVAGALVIGFAIVAACVPPSDQSPRRRWLLELLPMVITVGTALYAVGAIIAAYLMRHVWGYDSWSMPDWLFQSFSWTLLAATVLGILFAWVFKPRSDRIGWYDWSLMATSLSVGAYLVFHLEDLQFRSGVMPTQPDFWVAVAGILLILELTRRVAGMALVVIAAVFILYGFIGPWLPGVLEHGGYKADRFFTYLYTDNGILGPTTAVSSTYIILFITFAAFLQASKVG
ncbi:MAG: TRAP transporter permease, partial [Chromatiaceae bacterium]